MLKTYEEVDNQERNHQRGRIETDNLGNDVQHAEDCRAVKAADNVNFAGVPHFQKFFNNQHTDGGTDAHRQEKADFQIFGAEQIHSNVKAYRAVNAAAETGKFGK